MRVGIVSVFVDYHRRGRKNRLSLQPQFGPLVAALLPPGVDIEIRNETFEDLDWSRDYDLLFISALHPDFDRARQISRYWQRRGATTVFGGAFASTFPDLCQPWFDSVVVGDAEATVPALFADFRARALKPRYHGLDYVASAVPTPRFDLLVGHAHHPLCFEATRGCPFACDFCVLSGLGTRHETRPVARVVRDIVEGQRMLAGRIPAFKRRIVGFCDNNIGGNLGYLRELCAALAPLRVTWYSSVTFNVIANRELVRMMAGAGCRALFVGLESFNPAAIADMRKFQNVLGKTRATLEYCREQGILVSSGLMASPHIDRPEDLRALPERVREAGLRLPAFLAFESPIPGTPYFQRLVAESEPAFLPNALLRDFAGYTLVVRPRQAPVDEFVAAYREAARELAAPRERVKTVLGGLPQTLLRGGWFPAAIELGDLKETLAAGAPAPGRTYVAGTDIEPPERVPLAAGDFTDERDRAQLMEPTRVTDAEGRVLPPWRGARPIYGEGAVRPPAAAIPVAVAAPMSPR